MQMVPGTWNIYSKWMMIAVIATCLVKTLFFLRIFMKMSYIVTMITNVVKDLTVFLTFYAIIIVMFSMVFDVISRNPSDEYKKIGWFAGNLMSTVRLSLNDFDMSIIEDKPLTK